LFLLTGLLPTCVGYGVEGALKFGCVLSTDICACCGIIGARCYELCKPFFATTTSNDLVNALLASTVAGAVASVVLCPAEDVRFHKKPPPTFEGPANRSGSV
jgi:solute carrier family 25 phosphate transporter 3